MGREDNTTQEKPLSILYCGNFVTKSVGEPEVAKCLEELGHFVTRIPEQTSKPHTILLEVAKHDYDIFLFSKLRIGSWPEVDELLKRLRKKKVKTICWLFDLYIGL